MPPRLRSKPYGPDSPNAPQVLPDPPRRRRATRSASAQPQEDQPAPPVREPKTRKTRGKGAPRGKKATSLRSPPLPTLSAEDPQPEELEGPTTSDAVDLQIQERPATPSVETPVTIYPSIETGSDPELMTPAVGVRESPEPSLSLRVSPASTTATEDYGNPRLGWLMACLRSMYRLCTSSNGATVIPAPAIISPAVRWSLKIPMMAVDMGQSTSALDDVELISILRAARSTGTASSRRHSRIGGSPASSSEQSRVLRAQGATPIRRSHVNRSNSRRIESRSSLGRTLYRLPQLLSFGSQSELQDDIEEETNRADEHDSLGVPAKNAAPDATPPSTPERAPPATPVAPLTAPPAGTDVSPGWSQWIFNGVSRRWTVLRGRFAHDDDNRNEAAEPTVPLVPDSIAEAAPAATATTSPIARAVDTELSIVSSASPAKINSPGFSSTNSRAQRTLPKHRLPPPFIPHSRNPPKRFPRPRSASLVDSTDLLGIRSAPYETRQEFVKRRQVARAECARQIQEAKAREEAEAASQQMAREERDRQIREAKAREDAKVASHVAAQLAKYAAKAQELPWKQPLPPPTPAKILTNVFSASAFTQDPINFSKPSQTTPITASIDPASRGRVLGADAVQAAAQTNVGRKRSRGFGLDEDDLAVHEEDFTSQEWEALKAEVEKAEQDAAKAVQQSAHPPKRRCVDHTSKQKKRTPQSARPQSTGTPRHTEAPNRTPGYVPNPRTCLAQPELSPIDSSGSRTGPESPSNDETPQTSTRHASQKPLKPHRGATTSSRGPYKKGMIFDGVFISERQFPNLDPDTQMEWRRREREFANIANLPKIPTNAARAVAAKEAEARKAVKKKDDERKELVLAKMTQPQHRPHGWIRPYAYSPVRTPPGSNNPPMYNDSFLRESDPAGSPDLPPPRRHIKRKRGPETSDDDATSLSKAAARPVKRSRGFEAPDPFASSSSTSSASPTSTSASPASLPPRFPYDAASHFARLLPQRHSPQEGSSMTTIANCSIPQTAEDENPETDEETNDLQDPSPLSRARNMAEQFKPKTPSRLRESARIPTSNASTPATLGHPSPSFPGVSMNNTPLRSSPMSIDGSSFVATPDATPAGAQATTQSVSTNTLQSQASSTAVATNATESAEDRHARDVAWLKETLPSGNFDDLQWPTRRSLIEALDIEPEAEEIVEQNWEEKGPPLAKYFETMFEAFQAAPNEFVLEL